MTEWHVTPDYIVNNWTDELFDLMTEKLKERRDRETSRMRGIYGDAGGHKVPESVLFARAGNLIRVIKKGT